MIEITEYAPARTLPSGILIVFPKYLDAEVSFGGLGKELRSLDKKGLEITPSKFYNGVLNLKIKRS